MTTETEGYEGWAILEIFGHIKVAGYVKPISMFGGVLARVEVPAPDGTGPVATQFYGASAIFCLTPCDEAMAKKIVSDSYDLPPPVRVALLNHEAEKEPSLPGIREAMMSCDSCHEDIPLANAAHCPKCGDPVTIF